MKIGGYDADYRSNYMERMQADRDKAKESDRQNRADNVKESEGMPAANQTGRAEKTQAAAEKETGFPPIKDEYIDSEESGRNIKGLYCLGQDEKGNPKVLYSDPEKKGKGTDTAQGKGTAKGTDAARGAGTAKEAEECTGSTDQVDREIEKLKERKKQLEQQISAAGEDEEKVKELERKLAQVETELNRKDNDAYRKQHMTVSQQTLL